MLWIKRKTNRKWQSQPQLYKGRTFYVQQAAKICLSAVVLAALVTLSVYLRNSDTLSIRRVAVVGDLIHLSREQVISLSGIKDTDKLFALSLGEVQEKIKRFSWIKSVSVRREFPDTIQIQLEERQPEALVLIDDLYFMDSDGLIFKKVEDGEYRSLPVITGFQKTDMDQYPHLSRGDLTLCLAFLNYLRTQSFYKEETVSELHFDRVFGFTVYTKESGLEIYYGKQDYEAKQQRLERFKESKEYKAANYMRLDLDSKDKVIARK